MHEDWHGTVCYRSLYWHFNRWRMQLNAVWPTFLHASIQWQQKRTRKCTSLVYQSTSITDFSTTACFMHTAHPLQTRQNGTEPAWLSVRAQVQSQQTMSVHANNMVLRFFISTGALWQLGCTFGPNFVCLHQHACTLAIENVPVFATCAKVVNNMLQIALTSNW